MKPEVKQDWARSIIERALAEIRSEKDAPRAIEKVEGTAVGADSNLMKLFKKLVDSKVKYLHSQGVIK